MSYAVEFSSGALKAIKKLNKSVAITLLSWISKNLEGTNNPRAQGKALTANLSGLWRYRVGDYRIIAEINDTKIKIVVIAIGHRKEIY
ncbi:MAG: type II toxin-antitoxin system RelE/ParE family toxin [Firmicutes bacterium]|nr:type II toxin-antitoxin system RelE/ParE family toxin [Bacillota bacterium]